MINSRLGLFTAAPASYSPAGAPLLPKLRGHFAEFLNESYPAHLRMLSSPTCVGLRYGHQRFSLEAFLGSVKSETSVLNFPPHHSSSFDGRISLSIRLTAWTRSSIRALSYPPASPLRSNEARWYRNVNLLSIAYAFRPRLRPRLTLSGRAFLRKP